MGKNFYNLEDVCAIKILDVCAEFGVSVEKKGRAYFCKLRDEKTASCKLYTNNADGHDTFYDFGSQVGGNVINFVAARLGCDWQKALESLAEAFHVEPVNNTEYYNRNELTDREYEKIGVYGDLATKNFDFDLEKYSLESAQKFAEKYAISVNQLRKDFPSKYENDILKKRAIPFVYELRNEYYLTLHNWISFQKSITGHFDINNVSESDRKECSALCQKLAQAEKLLEKALRGTNINYSSKEYNLLSDLKKIYLGEISFEIGEHTYADIKRESRLLGVDLMYRSVPSNEYFELNECGLNMVPHAAFVKKDMINLVFVPENSQLVDKCILNYNVEKLKTACVDVLSKHYDVNVSKEQMFKGSERVQVLTQYFLALLSQRSQKYEISDRELMLYSAAAMFHDVGKALIDQNIINKPGRLTNDEYDIVKTHSKLGVEILEKVDGCDSNLLNAAKLAAQMHHERWDGSGYPGGLKGDDIPVYVQAISLADVYNALRSERPYKKSLSHDEAVEMIREGKCGDFDTEILNCLDDLDSFTVNLYSTGKEELGLNKVIQECSEMPKKESGAGEIVMNKDER